MKCPCHSNKLFTDCCEPYLLGIKNPPTPLELMRSRYASYALDNPEYIIRTTHPHNPMYDPNKSRWIASIHLFSQTTAFRGLTIVSHEESGNEGFVTFHASLLNLQGNDVSFKEKSRFLRKNNLWLYHSGIRDSL
jgi:SEC-C motif-containing protein